ncbi:YdeI/OmpD-associated family protein [uncultured Marixanthomonas sp.]|uniref:YdeI/OmpD-associated family protein n=1 Tax=uncultured Marixanthomonas sp. TaxID=757245 RepID=UPI0030DDBC48|tara:strand:+ start:44141 stop:44737 length:597 start_codon:yes stop_codon:yes gene_type:complete
MDTSEKVTAYIDKHEKWSDELLKLRSIFQKTELTEEVKWGAPTYTLNGKLVAALAGFKNHYAIWFHQGVFLKNKEDKLVNAQEGVTKALRQWRFEEGDPIEADLILKYIQEAIENCIAGKELKPKRKKDAVIPPLLEKAFKTDTNLAKAFKNLTPGKQREYANHISEAKREATKESRLQKIIPMILDGKGLHDKYKNC